MRRGEQKKQARCGRQDGSGTRRRQETGRLLTERGEKVNNRRFPFDSHEPNFNDFREVRKPGAKEKSDPDLISDILKIVLIYTRNEKNIFTNPFTPNQFREQSVLEKGRLT